MNKRELERNYYSYFQPIKIYILEYDSLKLYIR